MTRREFLLICLNEECHEVGQRVDKALRFGLEEAQPGQPYTNAERIYSEFADLLGVMEMLQEDGAIATTTLACLRSMIDAKKEKVAHYMGYSVECGTLDIEAVQ